MMNYFHWIIKKSQRLRDLRRSRRGILITSEKGQALIEYMLMLVVTIVLVVGLALAVFQPLSDFLGKLNNLYVRCLLETGELPKVGTDGAATCDAEIPKFEVKNMDGSAVDPEKSASQNSENQKGQSSSSDGTQGTETNRQSPPTNSAGRKSSILRNGMQSRGGARAEPGGDKTTNIPIDNFEAGEGFMSAQGSGGFNVKSRQKSKRVDLSGLTEYERKKIEREQQKNRSIAVDSESFTRKANKKLIVKPPPGKKAEVDLNVDSDFSYYFKIFFFIVIILFIIILMGGQAMQMTNNSDS